MVYRTNILHFPYSPHPKLLYLLFLTKDQESKYLWESTLEDMQTQQFVCNCNTCLEMFYSKAQNRKILSPPQPVNFHWFNWSLDFLMQFSFFISKCLPKLLNCKGWKYFCNYINRMTFIFFLYQQSLQDFSKGHGRIILAVIGAYIRYFS